MLRIPSIREKKAMAEVDQVIREAKTRAQAAERDQQSTAKVAAEAKAESRRARLAYKKAKKALKKANKAARKARKAAESARAHLSKVSRTKKSPKPKQAAAKPEGAAAKPKAAAAKAKSAPSKPKSVARKAVTRRTARPARPAIAQPQLAQALDDAETFHMSEADLDRER